MFFNRVANGNQVGLDWLCLWHDYNHDVDDVIDENRWDGQSLLTVFMCACTVYSHPFYRQHLHQLQTPVMLATSMYADSVKWERDPQLWKRQWADVMRHAGNEVICAVAIICGGYEHMRQIAGPMLAMCYIHHKDKYGVPE